jgi:uncharacterized membrane protein (DUF106 family)
MKNNFIVLLTSSLVSVFGFMIAYYFEVTYLYPFLCMTILVSNISALLLLDFIDWNHLKKLNEAIKKNTDTYKKNTLFIKALKNLVVRKEFPLEDIEKEIEKIKK